MESLQEKDVNPKLLAAQIALSAAQAVRDPSQPDVTSMPVDMDISPRGIGGEAAVLVGRMLRGAGVLNAL